MRCIDGIDYEMSRVKTPQEKKQLHYDKDHVVSGGEAPHAFRRKWPKKKTRANRDYRRRADQLTKAAEKEVQADGVENQESIATREQIRKSVGRKPLVKWGVRTIRDEVEASLENRMEKESQLKKRKKETQKEPKDRA